jgi:large subunit ribosomal protein L19
MNKSILTQDSKQSNLISIIENINSSGLNNEAIKIGNIITIGYSIPEGEKERVQYYTGLVIATNNKTTSKTFKIRRDVQGFGVEQTFFINSPRIISIEKKNSSKVKRAKLYFMRKLKGKAAKLRSK